MELSVTLSDITTNKTSIKAYKLSQHVKYLCKYQNRQSTLLLEHFKVLSL